MEYYSKIDTLFRRKDDFSVDLENFTRPEFDVIDLWSVTEKIDGTSVLLHFTKGKDITWGGRTAKSNFTDEMNQVMSNEAAKAHMKSVILMERHSLDSMTVYGELYGPKIQNGGAYSDELQFRAFDVKVGEVFLSPGQFREACAELDLEIVPYMGMLSIDSIVEMCEYGFESRFSLRSKESEGIIAKSPVELRNNAGKRVMFKLKHRDFKAGKR